MNPQINLSALSVDELKALAYDCICQANFHQKNLQTIEQVIQSKQQEQQKENDLQKSDT